MNRWEAVAGTFERKCKLNLRGQFVIDDDYLLESCTYNNEPKIADSSSLKVSLLRLALKMPRRAPGPRSQYSTGRSASRTGPRLLSRSPPRAAAPIVRSIRSLLAFPSGREAARDLPGGSCSSSRPQLPTRGARDSPPVVLYAQAAPRSSKGSLRDEESRRSNLTQSQSANRALKGRAYRRRARIRGQQQQRASGPARAGSPSYRSLFVRGHFGRHRRNCPPPNPRRVGPARSGSSGRAYDSLPSLRRRPRGSSSSGPERTPRPRAGRRHELLRSGRAGRAEDRAARARRRAGRPRAAPSHHRARQQHRRLHSACSRATAKMSWLRATGDVLKFVLLSIVAIAESCLRGLLPMRYRMKEVSGEIALVTGGGNGLGRIISLRLAELGAIVVVWDINAKGLDETLQLIKAAGGTGYGYVCNLCDKEDVYQKAALVAQEVGRVSILINNAGVATGRKFLDCTDQMIIKTMEVNVMSHFWTVKAFLPGMMKENKGHIVSIASLAGTVGCPKLVDYTASKFAAVGFDEALCMELEADGYDIKTTVICPYFIRSTGMFDDVVARIVPTLTPNIVAERVITAMRCNEKLVVIPGYFQMLLIAKWIFPWKCAVMILRCLVHDAAPAENGSALPSSSATISAHGVATKIEAPAKDLSNGNALHQQLARRASNSERKP